LRAAPALAWLARPAGAQPAWPSHPLRLVVPFAPGGGADATARFVAQALGEALGQPVAVDNKGGGGGTLGAMAALSAPADGYTLFHGTPGPLITNPLLMANLPYDAERDFAPVSLLVRSAYVLVVNPALPAHSLAELLALATARPGQLAYSSAGIGAGSHLAAELLRIEARVALTHIPYRGTGPSVQDVVAGQVPMTIDSLSVLIPLIRAGRLRALGVTAAQRVPELPEVPTIAETLPGFEVTVINCLMARSGTPDGIVTRLSQALVQAMASPAAAQRYADSGAQPEGSTPAALGAMLDEERRKWRGVIARAGIRLE
jgi:tripartite-type tricarboxylate transporter receptor subunit TctC